MERLKLINSPAVLKRAVAFTLAEVLITLGIIGVVAAITLPQFMQDMSERVNSNRQANIAQKITKSVELMIVNGDYQGIYDTNQFVNKLSKYLKIAKKCDKNNLDKCWPSKKIKTAKGEEYDVADAKTSKALHTKGPETDTVGLVLADGASIILTFNPDEAAPSAEGGFRAIRKQLPVGNGKTKEFAYTSNATNAIDFVMDVNGGTGPNQEADGDNHYDIRSFRYATFTTGTCAGGVKIGSLCVMELGMDYDFVNCTKEENSQYCNPNSNYTIDFKAGARKACSDIGLRAPSCSELLQLYKSGKTNIDDILPIHRTGDKAKMMNTSGWSSTVYMYLVRSNNNNVSCENDGSESVSKQGYLYCIGGD